MTPSYCATLANPRHLFVSPPNPVGGETAFLPIDSSAALFYWSEAVPPYSANRKRCRPILPIGSAAALSCQSEALPLNLLVGSNAALHIRSTTLPIYSTVRRRCVSIPLGQGVIDGSVRGPSSSSLYSPWTGSHSPRARN